MIEFQCIKILNEFPFTGLREVHEAVKVIYDLSDRFLAEKLVQGYPQSQPINNRVYPILQKLYYPYS